MSDKNPIPVDLGDLFSDTAEGGAVAALFPTNDTPLAVAFTKAYWSVAKTGNVYVTLEGSVVSPPEYMGVTVRKSPLMISTTAAAQKAKNPRYTDQMASLQAKQYNQDWPRQTAKVLASIMGRENFEEAYRQHGGLCKEFVQELRGNVAWVLSKLEKDNRDNKQYLSFSIVKGHTTFEELGVEFEVEGDLGDDDGEEALY